MTTTATSWTAADLLEEGMCSARCMLAFGDGPCNCPCEGRWHGVLTDADVGEGITPEQRASMREAARRAAAAERAEARRAGREHGTPASDGAPRRRDRAPLPPGERDYPGAPVGDRRVFQVRRTPDGEPYLVAVGRNLGEHAAALVIAALAIVPEESPVRVVCREANQIRASRPDLADRRWLNIATCARAMRLLAEQDDDTTTERTVP
jgi:hypothetical protein